MHLGQTGALPLTRLPEKLGAWCRLWLTWTRNRLVSAVLTATALLGFVWVGAMLRQEAGPGALVPALTGLASLTGHDGPLLNPALFETAPARTSFIVAVAPLAALYALVTAFVPFRRRVLARRMVPGAIVLGYAAPQLPAPPLVWAAGPRLDEVAALGSGLAFWILFVLALLALLGSGVAVAGLATPLKISGVWGTRIVQIVPSRHVGPSYFRALPAWRRLAAAVLLSAVLLTLLWVSATVRETLLDPALPPGLSGAHLQAAYLPPVIAVCAVACADPFRGRPWIFRLATALVLIRGLWPWALPGAELFESLPGPVWSGPVRAVDALWAPHACWAAFALVPVAWLVTAVAARLMRWYVLPGVLPGVM
jgi:hypothetical protein